jgi:Flp pilus assembly pilin Flp
MTALIAVVIAGAVAVFGGSVYALFDNDELNDSLTGAGR